MTLSLAHNVTQCLMLSGKPVHILFSNSVLFQNERFHCSLTLEIRIFLHIDYIANASKGAAVIDQLIGTTLISTTICHQCLTVSELLYCSYSIVD